MQEHGEAAVLRNYGASAMNHKVGRRYLPAVMMASTLAVASACASTTGSGGLSAQPGANGGTKASATPKPATAAVAGALTISDGSADVTVGTMDLHLPSTATDVSWSSDGSRITYVDANGDIATALADGSDVRVLTKTNPSVLRAQPVYAVGGYQIVFSERGKDGVWHLKTVEAGTRRIGDLTPDEMDAGMDLTGHDHAATSAYLASTPGVGNGVNLLAFEHDAKAGAEVWIIDYNQREPDSSKLLDGSHPALSPDGKSIAYIGKNNQLCVALVAKPKSATQVTFGVNGIAHPVWTADGTHLTFATATDVESVAAKLAPGVTTNPTTVVSPKVGVASYVPHSSDSGFRLTGSDPIADSITLSKQTYNLTNAKTNVPSQGNLSMPDTVTLVSTADPTALDNADSLIANGPVLFTDGKTLDPRTAAEITRALAKPSFAGQQLTVALYGSPAVMSPAIETAAKALGYTVTRISPRLPQPSGLPVVVASDTDPAVLANLAHLGQNATLIRLHGSSSLTAAQRALFVATPGQPLQVYTAGADAQAAVAANWSGKPALKVTNLPASPSDESLMFQPYDTTSVTLVAAGDWKTQMLANQSGGLAIVLGADGTLSPAVLTWLHANAPTLATVNAYGGTSEISDATLAAAVAAISGPSATS
jgi:hypothetical protein